MTAKTIEQGFADLLASLAGLFEARAVNARNQGRGRIAEEIGQRFLTRALTYDEAAREVRTLERKLRNDEVVVDGQR